MEVTVAASRRGQASIRSMKARSRSKTDLGVHHLAVHREGNPAFYACFEHRINAAEVGDALPGVGRGSGGVVADRF